MYEKPARKGALPQLATPLFCFESAQQLKRPRREWRGSLPQLATLSILTRVKLDSSSGHVESGSPGRKHTRQAIRDPSSRCRGLGLRAGKPTRLT